MTKLWGVGMHFRRLPSPTPSSGRLCQSRQVRATPGWVLLISKDEDFMPSLFNLWQCLTTFTI